MGGYRESGRGRESGRIWGERERERWWEDIGRVGGYKESGRGSEGGRI